MRTIVELYLANIVDTASYIVLESWPTLFSIKNIFGDLLSADG